MSRLLLRLHDYLANHRPFAVVLLVVLLAAGALLALQLHYQENIADFLPRTAENAKQADIYNSLGDQGQITVIFRPAEEATDDDVMDAIDAFAEAFTALPVQARADSSDVMQAISLVNSNIPLYLTAADYRRIDSLLADPTYIARSMASARQTLAMPLPPMATDMIAADPLGLFSPALQRLQALSPSSRYRMVDDYIFDNDGNGFAFITSSYAASDTRNNSLVAKAIDEAIDNVQSPKVGITAVGAPLIAVTNASQIKHDSLLAIALAVVLITIILWRTMGRKRNILWMGFSVAAGWLFALAVIAIFKSEISIIVVGIGSVLVGIAVNYPLHYLEHLKNHPDRRETLREMTEPLVTGNITTVAAFACLVFVKAEAMRDLGLFGSLMLVGTIGFTLVFLPLWAKAGRKNSQHTENKHTTELHQKQPSDGAPSATLRPPFGISSVEGRPEAVGMPKRGRWGSVAFWVMTLATVVLGYFSTQVEFDADLHNINYMTTQQQADLDLLAASVDEGGLTYVVAEDATLEEALQRNDSLGLDGVAALMPSLARQEKALTQWHSLLTKHPSLADEVRREARRAGFADEAFRPFTDRLEATYTPAPCTLDGALGQLASNYILTSDTGVSIVNFVHGETTVPDVAHTYAFTQSDVGSGLVGALNADFNYILYVCSFVVFAFLWLALGRFELAVLAFLPMAMGWLWILGIMALTDIKFNIVNIILATFIFGQGDDYTIFITEGLLYENATGRRRLKEYRRSVIISAALMFVGIGTLIVARHPAMRSLAEVAMIGMGCVVLMACVVPPMVFRWLTMRCGVKREVPITLGRIVITMVPLLVFALFALLVATPVTLLSFITPAPHNCKRDAFHRFICGVARLGARLMPRVDFKTENPNGEDFSKPAVIVANHASHLDLLCMLALTPKLVIMTKNWVWRNPIYAHIIRYAEYLPAEAGYNKLMPKLKDLVARGYSVMIFPEGTRTHDGNVGRFHKGAFMLADELGLPILPVYIHGAYNVWPRHEALLREGTVTVAVGQRCHTDNHEARKMFIDKLEAMSLRIETAEYRQRMERYQYLYKGREVWHTRPRKGGLE